MATFSDFTNEFLTHPSTDDLILKNDELAIRQSVKNLVHMNFGDKPFHPEIGLNLRSILFENFGPLIAATTKRNIAEIINKFEPRVKVFDVDFFGTPDEGRVMISVVYKIKNTGLEQKIDLYLERVR